MIKLSLGANIHYNLDILTFDLIFKRYNGPFKEISMSMCTSEPTDMPLDMSIIKT